MELSTGAVGFYRYALDLVGKKAESPQDDYLSDLARAHQKDGQVTMHEIGATAFNLLFAGHETTSSAAANMFKAVLADRKLWQAICSLNQTRIPRRSLLPKYGRVDVKPGSRRWKIRLSC